MFRFIHTADSHIDSPLLGLEAYDGAPVETLRGATRRAFENLVALALTEQVDFVLIAGDVFDGNWKDFSTGLFFTRQMARLNEAGIAVFVISGNHDATSVITHKLSLPGNVVWFPSNKAVSHAMDGVPVTVHGRSFPRRLVPENLALQYPAPVAGRFNIGLLHTSLTGAVGHDPYAPCSERDLADKGYDYWALGHVHQPRVVARDPWVVYPGNLQGRDIGETGSRGCQLVTVNDSLEVVDAAHQALDVLRWLRIEVDTEGCADEDEVLDRLGDRLSVASDEAQGRLLAARVEFTGRTLLDGRLRRDPPALRAQCAARAEIAGGDIWIEELKVRTTATVDPAELAARDDLTRVVLESLAEAGQGELAEPENLAAMLKVLPGNIRESVQSELQPGAREAVLADVRAILLDALAGSR